MKKEINLTLTLPEPRHEAEALAYRREFIDRGETAIQGGGGLFAAENYESWLETITLAMYSPRPGWVRATTYFAIDGERIIGTIQIRHTLNDSLKKIGGHIGYSIRPSERRKGYGAYMLSLTLEKCRLLGIEKALVTCDENNVASAKTILKNGGVLENEVKEPDGTVVKRYWINL